MMANIWKALPYHLENNSGLSALVSQRIYPIRLPQTVTLPAMVFQDISAAFTQAHREKHVLPRPRFQFTIYSATITLAEDIAQALKAAISGYQGNMGTGSYLTEVEACLLKNELTDDDLETGIYLRYLDFVIQYKE